MPKRDRAVGEVPVLFMLHGLTESAIWIVKASQDKTKVRVMPYEVGSCKEYLFDAEEVRHAQETRHPLHISD